MRSSCGCGRVCTRRGSRARRRLLRAPRKPCRAHSGFSQRQTDRDVGADGGTVGRLFGVNLVDLGETQLKGVADPVHVFGVDADGAEWIDKALISMQASAGNLPRPQTELFTDLVNLQTRVSALAQARLVTLTGSGGVGNAHGGGGWLAGRRRFC